MEKEEEEKEKKCEICGKKVIKIEIRDIETQQLEEEGKKEEEKEGEEEKCLLCDEKATMECVTCGLMVCESMECQRRMRIQHEKKQGRKINMNLN